MYLQHVLSAEVSQLGILVCAQCICNGLEQAGRPAVVHQGVCAQVSSLSHHLRTDRQSGLSAANVNLL